MWLGSDSAGSARRSRWAERDAGLADSYSPQNYRRRTQILHPTSLSLLTKHQGFEGRAQTADRGTRKRLDRIPAVVAKIGEEKRQRR